VRADNIGVDYPDRSRDADVEQRVGNAVEAAKAWGVDAKAPRDLSVVYVRDARDDDYTGKESPIHVLNGEQDRDGAEGEPGNRERERASASKILMRRTVRPVITIVVVIAIVGLAARRIDWQVVAQSITHASLVLVVATAVITFASTLLKGVRWWLFLRKTSEIKLGRVVRLTILGTGANSVLFANAGDMIRVGLVAREARVPVSTVISALASDKVVEVLGFVTVMLVALGGQLPTVVRDRVETIVIALTVALIVAAFVGWASRGRISLWLSQTRGLLRGRTVVIAYAISLVSWMVQIATYAIGAMAVGLDVPLAAIVVTVVSVNVGGVIRSTPGNVGVFQLMFAVALAPFGVANASAVAAAVLIQSAQLLSAVIAGAVVASL
jgi:uncharacterized membrane protein YbhN (UPF0104 family)